MLTTLLQTLANGSKVLCISSEHEEFNRVFGATLVPPNTWYFPVEQPFISFVLADLEKLHSWKTLKDLPEIQALQSAHEVSHEVLTPSIPLIGKDPLRPHQVTACHKALTNTRYGIFMDCRTGKTLAMLYALSLIKPTPKTLVIGPQISCENWVKEVAIHNMPLTIQSIYGDTKKKRDTLLKEAIARPTDITITSFENLRINKDVIIASLPYDCLIVDESHRIKSMKALRTKAVLDAALKAKYRYLLSGTPTTRSPTDIYAQMQMLSPHILLNWNYYKFCENFIVYSKPRIVRNKDGSKRMDSKRYPVGHKNLEVLNTLIAPFILRVRRDECQGLPEREDVYTKYTPTKQQTDMMSSIIKDDYYEIDGVKYIVGNPASKFNKLLQVCSGFIYYYPPHLPITKENRLTHIFEDNPKLTLLSEHLEDYLENPSNKIIIWCNYDHEQALIKDKFSSYGLLELRGGQGDSFAIAEQFNTDPAIQILSAKQSMGISIDLSIANASINFSRSPSLEADRQSRDRIDGYRQASSSITCYYYTSERSVEEHVHQLISSKIDLDKALTNTHSKCIGCKNFVKCIQAGIRPTSPLCKREIL